MTSPWGYVSPLETIRLDVNPALSTGTQMVGDVSFRNRVQWAPLRSLATIPLPVHVLSPIEKPRLQGPAEQAHRPSSRATAAEAYILTYRPHPGHDVLQVNGKQLPVMHDLAASDERVEHICTPRRIDQVGRYIVQWG